MVYSFLNNLRQFLSRVLQYLTNTTNEKKTGLEGVPGSAEFWGWGQCLPTSAHRVALLPSQSLLGHQYVRLFVEKF